MFEIYRPSGAFGLATLPILLLFVAFGIGAAYLYQLCLEWIPFIYVSFGLTFVFGGALGAFGRLVVKAGHVRNTLIGVLIGLLIGGTSYSAKFWFQYENYLWKVAEYNEEEFNVPLERAHQQARQEISFMDHIRNRVEDGWKINQAATVNGLFVYLIWLIEGCIVLGLSITLPTSAAQEPYNETIGRWANEAEIIMALPIDNPDMVNQISLATRVDDLLTIPIPKSDETDQFAVYTVHSIPGHEMEDAYLSVNLTTISYDKDGNEQKKEKPLVKFAVLTSEQRRQLHENAELLNEAIEAYRQAKYGHQNDESESDAHAHPEDASPTDE